MSSVEELGIEFTEIYDGHPLIINPFDLPGSHEPNIDGVSYIKIDKSTINDRPQENYPMYRRADGIYNMHYKENPLSQLIQPSQNVINRRIEKYLSENLGNIWNMDAGPFSRIVASYIGMPIWTSYLDWMYCWTKQKRNIESLNLILEYAFKKKELVLLKLPSHIAIEQDGWKITPIIGTDNGYEIDSSNFTRKSPLLMFPSLYTCLNVKQKITKRIGPNLLIISPVPKIFYSSSFSQGNLWLSPEKRCRLSRDIWNYSSLDEIVICNGKIRPKISVKYESKNELNLDLEDFTYCQLCDRETFICSVCEFRDLLFCHIHSGMIHSETVKYDALTGSDHLCKKCRYRAFTHPMTQAC